MSRKGFVERHLLEIGQISLANKTLEILLSTKTQKIGYMILKSIFLLKL